MRQGIERLASYSRQVDNAFLASAGLSYSYLREELERSGLAPRLEDAASRNLAPTAFVEAVSRRFGLRDVRSDDAVPYNRRVAALVEFAVENPDWSVGPGGAIFREGPDGIERLSPGRDVAGRRFGFAAAVSRGGSLDVVDGEATVTGRFVPVTGAIDIGDAVTALESRYDNDNDLDGEAGPRMRM